MKKISYIGFSGKIGSGKDTSAQIVQEILLEYGIKSRRVALGDRLKEVVKTLCKTNVDQWSHEGKNTVDYYLGKTYGQLQQLIGAGLRELVDPDIWVKLLLDGETNNEVLLISDVRFRNEASMIQQKNGLLIRLEGDPKGVREKSNRDQAHISETDLDDWETRGNFWDLKVDNSHDDLEELKMKLKTFIIYFFL